MSSHPARQKLWPFLKSYLKQSLEVYKHPKQLLPTIILTVVWMVLGIVQLKVKENLPMQVFNFITYAQGGLYGGVVGAIGGILGKVVVAAFVNALIVPLFSGKKSFDSLGAGFKELRKQISFNSKEALAPLLKGLGAAMLIYILFNTTGRFENSMVGIMAAVAFLLAIGKRSGFVWGLAFSYARSVSGGRTPGYQNVMRGMTGISLGFAVGVALDAAGLKWGGLIGMACLIAGLVMGKKSARETVSALFLICLTFTTPFPAQAKTASTGGSWTLVNTKTKISKKTFTDSDKLQYRINGSVDDFHIQVGNQSSISGRLALFPETCSGGQSLEGALVSQVEGDAAFCSYVTLTLQDPLTKRTIVSEELVANEAKKILYTLPTQEEAARDEVQVVARLTVGPEGQASITTTYFFKWKTGGKGWAMVDKKTERTEYHGDLFDSRVDISNIQGTVTEFSMDINGGRFSGSIKPPFKGIYKPGQEVQLQSRANRNGINSFQICMAHKNLLICSFWDEGKEGWVGWELRDDNPPYSFEFPTREEVGSDTFSIVICVFIGVPQVATTYYFQWGGTPMKDDGDDDSVVWGEDGGEDEFAVPEWFKVLFGDGDEDHTNEAWTIFVSLVGGAMAGGAAGGAGGMFGGGGPEGWDGWGGDDGPSPEEREWRRQKEATEEERRRQRETYTKENPDGSRTIKDPATGKYVNFYPTDDGGWESDGGTRYSEDQLSDWLDDRERNAGYHAQNDTTARHNLDNWREKNLAEEHADRQRGSTRSADEYKKARQKDEYIERVEDKYGWTDREQMKKEAARQRQADLERFRDLTGADNALTEMMMYTEWVQKTCDGAINVGATVVPGGEKVRDVYSVVKGAAGRGAEAKAQGGSWGDVAKGSAFGAAEGGMEVWANHTDGVMGNAAINTGKSIMSNVYDGKDTNEIIKDAEKTAVSSTVGNLINKGIDKGRQRVDIGIGVNRSSSGKLKTDGDWKVLNKIWTGTKTATETSKEAFTGPVSEGLYKKAATYTGWRKKEDFEDD